MSHFEGVEFQGTFRRFQQRVLDNAEKCVAEGKLNIVATPGSGKTILGLELIRRLGAPCLIISPTESTRDHWGKRLREHFLSEESQFEKLFSTDLEQVKLINAITYPEFENFMDGYPFVKDGGRKSIKIRKIIRKYGIKTICLDEPHHLKEGWIRALEKMQDFLEKDVKIISLTATPPCEYEELERKRFFELCGEIDEEILAPELVAEKVFCPHQDYVYFNYPSVEEAAILRKYMDRVRAALEEIGQLECVRKSIKIGKTRNHKWEYDNLKREYPEEYICVLQLLQYYGLPLDGRRAKGLTGKWKLPPIQMKDLQIALQVILEYVFVDWENRDIIKKVLKKHGVYQDEQVQLIPPIHMQKALAASVGKLQSISEIVKQEHMALGKNLRLVVFTEGCCQGRENLSRIGTYEEFTQVDEFSIFETIRRWVGELKMGVYLKDLLILPDIQELQGTMMRMEPIMDTGYYTVEFFGGMAEAAELVKYLFQQGRIQVLIGNRDLLEGDWKETGINSLILPGLSQDFFLSNAMRGKALLMDEKHYEKNVNIWHLATLEPADMVGTIDSYSSTGVNKMHGGYLESYDFEMVKNRFQIFMGPNYESGEMESTIKRVTLLRPPYDALGIQRINREMLAYSANRETIGTMWKNKVQTKPLQVVLEAEILPEKIQSLVLGIRRMSLMTYYFALLYIVSLPQLFHMAFGLENVQLMLFTNLFLVVTGILFLNGVRKMTLRLWKNRSLKKSLKTLGEALKGALSECGLMSPDGMVHVEKKSISSRKISIQLRNATMHDQSIFNKAITEMMSPEVDQRYILKAEKYFYKDTFTCPEILGNKEKMGKIMVKHLEKSLGGVKVELTGYPNRFYKMQTRDPYESKKYILVYNEEEKNG